MTEGLLDAVVIGGGITGLTLAHELTKRDKKFCLIEPSGLGGLIQTNDIKGFTLENGPNVFVEKESFLEQINELGLSGDIVYPIIDKYTQLICSSDGLLRPAPKGIFPFIGSSLFSVNDKISILCRLFKQDLLKPKAEDESVVVFFGRLIGDNLVRSVLDPALKGIYGGKVDKLSARSLFPGLWQAAQAGSSMFQYMKHKSKRGNIFVLKGGASSLITELADQLDEQSILDDAVSSVSRDLDGMWHVNLRGGALLSSRHVFLTTSGINSAKILENSFPAFSRSLESIEFASLSVVHCSVESQAMKFKNSFGAVFPEGMKNRLLGIMFNSELFPHMAPRDRTLLTVCLGGADSMDDPTHLTPEESAETSIQKFLGIDNVTVINSKYWKNAIPQLNVGHYKIVADMRRFEQTNPGIIFCGTDTGGVGVPDRVEVAKRVFMETFDV